MTFLVQAASSRSLVISRRALQTQRARFSNARFTPHPSPCLASSSPAAAWHNDDHDDETTTQQQLRSFATMNKNDSSYSDRARAGMTKARANYKDGMTKARTKARESYAEALPKAQAGAATSFEKLKQYGPVFAGTYASLYIGTLCGLYAGIDSGLIDPATVFSYIGSGTEAESKNTAEFIIDYLNHWAWTKPAVPFFEKNPHFANLGVAWVATKFTEPVRLVFAMVVVPRLAHSLGYVPTAEGGGEAVDTEQEEAKESVDDAKKKEQ